MTAHWGIEDPARVVGTPVVESAAFVQALKYMRNRITTFTSLPLASIDRMTLQNRVRAIGSLPGASLRKPNVA
jgi:arsenate reductase